MRCPKNIGKLFRFPLGSSQNTTEIVLSHDERVCFEMIVEVSPGKATVKDRCFMKGLSGVVVETDASNVWITFIYVMLSCIRFGVFFFGPLLLISVVGRL